MAVVVHILSCFINVCFIRIFTDLSLGDWETWVWFCVPFITYCVGVELGRKSK